MKVSFIPVTVQDGGPCNGDGRAEFIDMDIEKLKARGIAYAIPQVNSYTGQKFSEQPHTCFGVMKRTDDDMGETFEPATVVKQIYSGYECRLRHQCISLISKTVKSSG